MSSRRARTSRVRIKVIALLVSMAALWVFAAFVTVREGLNLLSVTTIDQGVAQPQEELVPELQRERRLTEEYLGSPNPDLELRNALAGQRAITDEKISNFIEKSGAGSVRFAADDLLESRLDETASLLNELSAHRRAIDAGTYDRAEARRVFNDLVESVLSCIDAAAAVDDEEIAKQARMLTQATRSRELLSREDSLLRGALAAGSISAEDHAEFAQLVGARRFLLDNAIGELPPADQQEFLALLETPAARNLRAQEDMIIVGGATDDPTLRAADWDATASTFTVDLQDTILASGDRLVEKAIPMAIGVVVRLALAGVLGLIAVIASVVISITTARQLVRQLERLRNAARDLASYRLPRVVERLQQGEQVDVKQEAPPLEFGTDEIGQVGEAFNQVQETAIRVAVEQAELRRSVRDVFLSLARRSQALLHRQLGLLDAMERRTTDSEELAELFRIDHLATRMRRNAENLIVLSGATAGRAWRKPVPMVDVLRGALAEVEDYTRVTVLPVGNASLLGRAVGDVIHLLAELIENAVSFSPPQTTVRVGGSVVGYGFAVEIEDRGLGMTPEELAAANEQLRDPPEFRLTSTARLGLYVVAKLAERHGIRVRLAESPYGGTTAIVLLPGSIMAESEGDDAPDRSQLDSYRPAQLAGVGRHRLQTDTDRPVRATVVTEQRSLRASQNGHGDAEAVPVSAPALPARPRVSRTEQADAATSPAREAEAPLLTPAGLPWRQRRRSTEQQPTVPLPASGTAQPGAPVAPATPRDPDTTRTKIDSYRSGTLRGRSDAARLTAAAGADTVATGTGATHGVAAGDVPAGDVAAGDVAAGDVPAGGVPTRDVPPPDVVSGGFTEAPTRDMAGQEPALFPSPQPAAGTPGTGGADEYPLWAASTTDLAQWTQSTPRTTEEGG